MRQGFVIAIVGAESTGKTTLAGELRDALSAEGREVVVVDEYLREFCDRLHRTPRRDEQAHIAFEQTRRIAEAAATHDIVIADTTALMIAVYSDQVFDDHSLDTEAAEAQRRADLTLLTALDLPWVADGHQRDGEHVREPVDARVRASLQQAGLAYSIVGGHGPARLAAAMKAVRHALGGGRADDEAAGNPKWHWVCERCGDVDCERHLLAGPARGGGP
jgi:nicotinamide riboside kinase